MRFLVIALLLPACGRIGFDGLARGESGDGGAGDDGGGGNGDGPDGSSAAVCGTSVAFTDDFVATTRSAQWLLTPNTGYTISQGGGDLSIAFAATVGASLAGGYTQAATVDMTGGCVVVQVDAHPNAATSAYSYMVMANAANSAGVGFEIAGNNLQAIHYESASASSIVKQAAFDPVAQKKLRLRETGGTYFFDTSPDGNTFTQFTSWDQAGNVPPSSGLRMEIGASTGASSVNNGGVALWGPVSVVLP